MFLCKLKPLKIEIEVIYLESTKFDNLLGLAIDLNLIFDTHISNIYKTFSVKIKVVSRTRNAFEEKQAKLLYNSFNFSNMDALQ